MQKLKKWLDPAPIGFIQMFLFVLIELLLIFGKEFSKFHLVGQLHLYDTLLFLLTIGSGIVFLFRKDKQWNIPVLAILFVSITYVIYSYFMNLGPMKYMVRQYAIFIYLGCMYLIFHSFVNEISNKLNIRFIAFMGVSAFILQLSFHIYNFIFTDDFGSIFFSGFNYISLMAFMALFVFEAYLLVYMQKWWKWPLLLSFMFLSFTMGHHSSAIIGTISIFGAYLFIHSKLSIKIVLILSSFLGIYGLYNFVPDYFQDYNSLWRLLYWKMALKEIILEYYGIFGHGFGIKYTSPEILEAMRTQLDSPWMEVRPEEQYLSPMHNSFITIAFHISFIFLIVLFLPLKRAFQYILNRSKYNPKPQKDFLVLSLIGVISWTSFHVVLELPHSSAFFWLIYFTTIYHFNSEGKQQIESKAD